jgi:hypothetical protein
VDRWWERLFRRFVDESARVSVKNILFGLEPVVELRARSTTALHGEFVGSMRGAFFE